MHSVLSVQEQAAKLTEQQEEDKDGKQTEVGVSISLRAAACLQMSRSCTTAAVLTLSSQHTQATRGRARPWLCVNILCAV